MFVSGLGQEQQLIIDDEPSSSTTTIKRLGEYCDAPDNLCVDSESLAASIRGAASASCDYLLRIEAGLAIRGYPTNGLGVVCSPPSTNVISASNFSSFLSVYDPCQLKNITACGAAPAPTAPAPTPDYTYVEPVYWRDAPEYAQYNIEEAGGEAAPEDGTEEKEGNAKYVVGGILAFLVVGGLVFAATRKKKKKGKK